MSFLKTLDFFTTPDHACSYLPDKEACSLFADPKAQIDKLVYSQLSALGFRRSGKYIYRPHCLGCNECISVRIPVADFVATKSQRRVLAKNKDLSIVSSLPEVTEEYYKLYARYINERHRDGDMFPPNLEQFISFLVESESNTVFLNVRDEAMQLLAVAVVDFLDHGISAVYTFFEPDLYKRSLGIYCILQQIDYCKAHQLDYLYLGYWIEGCQKMSYKTMFQPAEYLSGLDWIRI